MSVDLYAGVYSMMAAAAGAGVDRTPEDPFANETPLSEEEMLEQRGGFFVSGFLLDFGIKLTELTFDAIDPGNPNASVPASVEFDPTTANLLINNTVDGAVISSKFQLDIAIPNFSRAVDLAGTANGIASLRVESRILDPGF